LLNRSLRSRRALMLAGGCCSSLLAAALPSVAWAQSTSDQTTATQPADTTGPGDVNAQPPADKDAIVVTGIRKSIRDSIEIKRRERGVVEAVSAEEIGKLPDVSIAESIARLPGLTAQRVAGRAQIVSIRGFSPDFTTVLLNGRQQASSGFNRAVEFDQYPSELLSSVVVYKSPDSSISGMGLAGTVDLRTWRPLSYGKRQITLNLRGTLDEDGGRNDGMSKWGWRGTVSYIDQNPSGTLGWSLGYAHLDAPGHTDHTKNWFYDNYAGLLPDGSPYFLSGQEARAYNRRDLRDGFMGTLEWKPSDRVHSVLDLYYSRFKQHEVMHGAEWYSDAWADGVTYSNFQTANRGGNDFEISGHVGGNGDPDTGVVLQLRNDDNTRTDKLFSAGLNNEFLLTDKLKLLTDLSYSSNKRDETYIETYAGYGVGPLRTRTFDEYDIKIPANDFPQFTNFGLNYADANQVSLGDRGDPWGGWGHDGLDKSPHVKETLTGGDATLRYETDQLLGGFFSSVEAGLNYTHRHKSKTVDELDLFLKNGRVQTLVDPRFLNDPTSLSFAGDWDVLAVNIADALGTYYDVVQLQDANHFDKAWDIKEDITTFKAKANIDSGDLHGNVGVQIVRQKQDSRGLRINDKVSPIELVNVDEGASYTDVLPSLNLYYDLNRHNRIRLALAKVMARPRMDDMRANLVPSFSGSVCSDPLKPPCTVGQEVQPWSASGGNPKLEPWRAKELDLAYEWYGGKASYFSVNAFYMWLDNYIYTQTLAADFTGLTPPPAQLAQIPSFVVISPIGPLSAPANGQGGWIRGVEVSGAWELGRMTRLLDGFGVQGSVSYTDYKLKPDAAGQIGVLPGFSKWVYNLTGYYEKNGFQARASYRYRSKFKGEVVSLFTNLGSTFILADKQLDAQVGYTFQKGSRLENLGVTLQVNNVLDSPYRTSYDVNGTQTLETFEKYGRTWLLGASYHF
jgi:iron complex outermembrane receptor protein